MPELEDWVTEHYDRVEGLKRAFNLVYSRYSLCDGCRKARHLYHVKRKGDNNRCLGCWEKEGKANA